jgi:hypothetical protein
MKTLTTLKITRYKHKGGEKEPHGTSEEEKRNLRGGEKVPVRYTTVRCATKRIRYITLAEPEIWFEHDTAKTMRKTIRDIFLSLAKIGFMP